MLLLCGARAVALMQTIDQITNTRHHTRRTDNRPARKTFTRRFARIGTTLWLATRTGPDSPSGLRLSDLPRYVVAQIGWNTLGGITRKEGGGSVRGIIEVSAPGKSPQRIVWA